ncbi:MAG TPA: hypothetical protein VK149_13030 [Sideroxyarcus sp.]|nr:hypothetical protein [Sideroxyarcus sp.]
MRIKSNWFKAGREHSPEELAGAVSFVVYRIADNALKNTRKAEFEVAVGAQYFAFLNEFLLFLIQVADRIAYRRFSAEERFAFTSTLAKRIAETHAENESRLLGGEMAECKRRFIDQLNQRADEYAAFGYDEKGPDYGFYRYLAFCIGNVLDEKDANWVIDPMISFEAPEAVEMIEKTFRNLLETEPRQPRRRSGTSGD